MLNELYDIILERKHNPTPGSYTASLFEAGLDEILKKVGEESIEVVLAAKGQGRQRVIEETADLFYHSLVLLAAQNIQLSEVEAELARRHQRKTAR